MGAGALIWALTHHVSGYFFPGCQGRLSGFKVFVLKLPRPKQKNLACFLNQILFRLYVFLIIT